jgi:uncharacterized protein
MLAPPFRRAVPAMAWAGRRCWLAEADAAMTVGNVLEGPATDELSLVSWRRRVFALYAEVRGASEPRKAWERWRATRDELFRHHPQSPLPPTRRSSFPGIDVYPYDPVLRTQAHVEETGREPRAVGASRGGDVGFTRIGTLAFELRGERAQLPLLWLDGYAGGLFVPFRDTTSGSETYGGGRYLLDTVKGADLGERDGRLILDFNFAYNPSCAHDPRWACPLAPPDSALPFPVRAGERTPRA